MAGVTKPNDIGNEMTDYVVLSFYSHNSVNPNNLFNGIIGQWPANAFDWNYSGDYFRIQINKPCNVYIRLATNYLRQSSALDIQPMTYKTQNVLQEINEWQLWISELQAGIYLFSHLNGYRNDTEWFFEEIEIEEKPKDFIIRLNSNIYKNIFPETVSDTEYINKIINETPTSTESLSQLNHGLQIGDVVYLDDDGLYKKALAENSNKSNVAGVVSKVNSSSTFTLMNTGKIDYQHLDYTDTSILYLSDKIPGKLVHYSNIDNMIYVPVAMYADNKIIVNIQQGSTGDYLAPYKQEVTNFDPYEQQDLDDIVNQVKGGVLNAK